jgi:uncharacterized metal-binding protein YceD (DUF177 family)
MMSALITWIHDTDAIADDGLDVERVASADERAELAKALGLVACERLETRYTIRPLANGQYLATGTVEADVVQSCVVTLEPVGSRIAERFEVDFWPPEKLPEPSSGEFDVLAGPDHEPIEDGTIPIGRIIYEHVATGLDPYPRKEGAEFRWQPNLEARANDEPRESPFAVLAKLKPKG